MIKLQPSLLVACATLALPLSSIHAAALASDNAGNYTAAAGVNDNNYAGRNFGTGFSAYNVSGVTANNSNTFLGTSTNNAGGSAAGNGGGIDTNGQSFGLFANSGNQILVNRSFTADASGQTFLAAGQTFSLDLDNGYVNNGSAVGFNLLTTAGTDRFTFQFTGGTTGYTFNTGTGSTAVNTQIAFTGNGLHVAYTQGAANSFTVAITPAGGATQTFTGTTGGVDITQFQVFNNNAGSGPNYDVFFNNPAVVPEPGTMATVGIGALGALLIARRRRRA